MPKYKVMFNTQKSGVLTFDAENSEEAVEIYDQLINGETYPDEINAYEDIDESDTMWFELTDGAGRVLAS